MSEEVLDRIRSCTDCELCVEVCPTYAVTGEPLFSPVERLRTAATILEGFKPDERGLESVYNCPKCSRCTSVCPEGIDVAGVVHEARVALVHRGWGPLEGHRKVISGILRQGNSVRGDPAKRLEWLPGPFPTEASDTLLYLGCLPSYLLKDTARAAYLVLQKLGVEFMLLEDEGCCGTYIYESGSVDAARDLFRRNLDRFRSLGIRRIVAPCNGCFKCFKYFYPDLLGETGLEVRHVADVVHERLRQDTGVLRRVTRAVTVQDPCRLSRGEGMTQPPRDLLTWCGAEVNELPENRGEAACCGAGGGIRSVYRDLSARMAERLLSAAATETVVTACPFCEFNLNYAAREMGLARKTVSFLSVVLESLGSE